MRAEMYALGIPCFLPRELRAMAKNCGHAPPPSRKRCAPGALFTPESLRFLEQGVRIEKAAVLIGNVMSLALRPGLYLRAPSLARMSGLP